MVEQRRADHLVDGVVTADVLARHQQPAAPVEERGGVEAAGLREARLARAQLLGQRREPACVDDEVARHGRRERAQLLDGRAPADAARALDRRAAPADRPARLRQGHQHDVVARRLVPVVRRRGGDAAAVGDRGDVLGAIDDPFGEEESAHQLEVVAGGPHDDGEAARADADLERLLVGEPVRARGTPGRFRAAAIAGGGERDALDHGGAGERIGVLAVTLRRTHGPRSYSAAGALDVAPRPQWKIAK